MSAFLVVVAVILSLNALVAVGLIIYSRRVRKYDKEISTWSTWSGAALFFVVAALAVGYLLL